MMEFLWCKARWRFLCVYDIRVVTIDGIVDFLYTGLCDVCRKYTKKRQSVSLLPHTKTQSEIDICFNED